MKTLLTLLFAIGVSAKGLCGKSGKNLKNADQYIYLVRHGKRSDTTDYFSALTPEGEKQPGPIADYFLGLETGKPSELYASPYKRTLQTAAPTAKKLNKKLKIDNALKETLGDEEEPLVPTAEELKGYLEECGIEKDEKYKNTDPNAPNKDGPKEKVPESPESIVQRLGKFLKASKIHERSTGSVAVFSHTPTISYLIPMLVAEDLDAIEDFYMDEGAIVALKKEAGSDQWHLDPTRSVLAGRWMGENKKFFKWVLKIHIEGGLMGEKHVKGGLTNSLLKSWKN